MPETSPLLPRPNRHLAHEHPIFLRVCHSPWYFIGQRSLLLLRGLTAIYMTVVLAFSIEYEIKHKRNGELYIFNATHISFIMQVIYYWITTLWTFQHLIWPRSGESSQGHGFVAYLRQVFFISRTNDYSVKNKLAFSIFYTCATTFPFVVTFLYWIVLEETKGHEFVHGGVGGLVHYNMCGINALIALVEILLLSSVRKLQPFANHILALLCIVGLYFVWAAIGHYYYGDYIYRQLDPDYNEVRGVVMTIVTTMSLTVAFFLICLGLHNVRDYTTAKAECDRQNP